MADYRYDLYDTYVFGAAASSGRLFQTAMGGDATHIQSFTNMRGAGQLPQSEKFVIDWIGAVVDFVPLIANVGKLALASNIELIIANQSVLLVPLARVIADSAYGGHAFQAVAADLAIIGQLGNGFSLADHPLLINGGTQFTVVVNQGTAVAAASNVKFILSGVLSIP